MSNSKNYTDYLIEDYMSQEAATETDRKTAEEAFKKELVNGPEQTRINSYGRKYTVHVGSFDLENFHKAYDKDLEAADWLKEFDDNGKFKSRSVYGKIKALDKTDPLHKVLMLLWAAQFDTSVGAMTFLKDKLAAKAKVKAEEDKKKAEQEIHDKREAFAKEVEEYINEKLKVNDDWQELQKLYTDKLNIEVRVNRETDTDFKLALVVNELAKPPKVSIDYYYFLTNNQVKETDDVATVADELLNLLESKLPKYIDDSQAIRLVAENYITYVGRPECVDGATLEKAYYFNKITKGIYYTKDVYLDQARTFRGIILVDAKTNKNTALELTDEFDLVATVTENNSSNSSGTYHARSKAIYYNSTYYNRIKDILGLKPDNSGAGYGEATIETTTAVKSPFDKYFDRYYYECYEIDSSD